MRYIEIDIYSKILLAGSILLLLFTVMVLVWVTKMSGDKQGDVFVLEPLRPLTEDSQVSLSVPGASAPVFHSVVYPGSSPPFFAW